jgi:hypothetical protein
MAYDLLSDPRMSETKSLGEMLVKRLSALGKSLAKDGKPLQTQDERLQQATTLADAFLNKTWVTWKKLGVI